MPEGEVYIPMWNERFGLPRRKEVIQKRNMQKKKKSKEAASLECHLVETLSTRITACMTIHMYVRDVRCGSQGFLCY